MPGAQDGQHDKVNLVAALSETEIRTGRGHDLGRTQGAANRMNAVCQFCKDPLPVDDGKIEEIGGRRRRIERTADFEFLGDYSSKSSRMLDEQILVTLANDVAHAEIQCRQEYQVHGHHGRGDEFREGGVQSCHKTRMTLTRASPATSLAHTYPTAEGSAAIASISFFLSLNTVGCVLP